MKKYTNIIVILVAVFAFFLRVYRVSSVPPSLSWDEVSIGYNAYSILTTGKDEHGRFLPLDTFVSFGDYKPPLPIYATVPSILVFGLNEFGVRFPSVFAGTLTVLLTFFLVRQLFRNSQEKDKLAIITSLLLAISPWHIQLSRAGYEANIGTMFVVLGVYLVLASRIQTKLMPFCWIPFVLGVYTFNSTRYVCPLLGIGLFVYCYKDFIMKKRELILGIIFAFLLLLPILPHIFSPESRLRFKEVSIFNDLSVVIRANERIEHAGNTLLARILLNRRIGYLRSILKHFFDHFDPWFLYIRGDGNPKFSIQDVGELYIFEGIFLFMGFVLLFIKSRNAAWFLLYWLFAAILPASLAKETPHALRIENSLPVWQVFIAYGIATITDIPRFFIKKRFLIGIIIFLYLCNFLYFQHIYYAHYPREYSGEWQYGYKQAIEYVLPIESQYDRIEISETIGRPYIYTAFYTKLNPKEFQKQASGWFDEAGFYHIGRLGKYTFIREGFRPYSEKTLYVLNPKDVPSSASILHEVKLLNGETKLVIFKQ